MPLVDIKFEEFYKTAIESARKGDYLRNSQVNEAVANFLRQYDWVIALWPDASHQSGFGGMEIRNSGKKEGNLRCNSIPCAERETALKLHALCRGADNHASDPPAEHATSQSGSSDDADLLFAHRPIGPGTRH